MERLLERAADVVREGGLIVYPTDTVYGLGCDPFNERAVEKVFEVKGRREKPLPVLCSSISKIDAVCSPPPRKLMEVAWPGEVTFVLPLRDERLKSLSLGRESLGVRIPRCSLALSLIERCGGYLVGTSANITGAPPPRTVNEAFSQLGGSVSLYINGGVSPLGIPSLVVDLTGEPKIVRKPPTLTPRMEAVLRILRLRGK